MDIRQLLAEVLAHAGGTGGAQSGHMFGAFPDAFETLFGGGDPRGRSGFGTLSVEQLKKHLAQMPDEERDAILEDAPKEILEALGVVVVTVKKLPDLIFAESELAGNAAKIKHLQNTVKGFYMQDEKSTAVIKKLKEEKKKLETSKDEQAVEISRLRDELGSLNRKNAILDRKIERLSAELQEKKSVLTETFQDLSNAQDTVEKKDQEIAALTSTAGSFARLQDAVISMDSSGNKSSLFGEIGKVQALVAAMQQKDNGADAVADETLATTTSQEKSPEEPAGGAEQQQ